MEDGFVAAVPTREFRDGAGIFMVKVIPHRTWALLAKPGQFGVIYTNLQAAVTNFDSHAIVEYREDGKC